MSDGSAQVLVFALGDAWYAVPAHTASEVVTFPPLTPLPGAKAHLRGVFAHRGEVIPVIDLSVLLGEGPTASNRGVLVRVEGSVFALVTTRVAGIEPLAPGGVPLGEEGVRLHLLRAPEEGPRPVTRVDVAGLLGLLGS